MFYPADAGSRKHLHPFQLLWLVSTIHACARIPQIVSEDHGTCWDAEWRRHQGCSSGLSRWVRQEKQIRRQEDTYKKNKKTCNHKEKKSYLTVRGNMCIHILHRERGAFQATPMGGYLQDVLFTVGGELGSCRLPGSHVAGDLSPPRYQSVYVEYSHIEDQLTRAIKSSHPKAFDYLSRAIMSARQGIRSSNACFKEWKMSTLIFPLFKRMR